MKVLLLAGTAEARALAALLVAEPGVEVLASLAGHTTAPVGYPCRVRTGGFGGTDGLAQVLRDERVDVLVDATHPFSAVMPWHAAAAATAVGVPRLRLVRPPWTAGDGDRWVDVADLDEAAVAVAQAGASTVLLTVGRLGLHAFAGVAADFVVRSVEAPEPLPLPRARVVLGRGPFAVEDEVRLLQEHGVELLVTKNSGGDDAKLRAARLLGLPVVVVRRPAGPDEPVVATPEEALDHLHRCR